MRREGAFTLVEIMIVVAIIAVIAAIAVPAFMRARERTKIARLANTLRLASDAFVMYAADHNRYPDGTGPGQMPAGMTQYLARVRWTEETLAGGEWQWQGDQTGGAVTISQPTAPVTIAQEIDRLIDDGDEHSGAFRITENHWRYTVEN
jgi:prepilin-type N-terminal cleavage/methylation domain-containing protein